ncbi:MAG: MFS transporter [Candidatus Lokiarchaeota archaeon]|nr:MFS transporter [Candidatus Lokiarchaeota archaeon]
MRSPEELSYWRFWPVFILAFFYPMNNGMINLAIPIYYLQEGLNTALIGILSAGSAISYMFSPILLNKLSQKLKRKTSITISLIGVFCSEIIFYFSLNPLLFLISRSVEGIFMGLYWPNLQSAISDNIFHKHSALTAKYNISWNSGMLTGFLFGALLLFSFGLLELIFYAAPILIFINLLVAVSAFQEPKKLNIHSKEFKDYVKEQEINLIKAVKIKKEEDDFRKLSYPRLYPVLIIVAYCLTRASVNFLYPIKSELLGFEEYTVYIATFFLALSQVISMFLASLMKLRYFNFVPPIMIGILIIVIPLIALNQDLSIFIILFFVVGSCTGVLYGVTLRMILMLNIKNDTSKFSGILESLIGAGFLITPIFSGFIAAVDLNITFYVLTLIIGVLFVFCMIVAIYKVEYKSRNNRD